LVTAIAARVRSIQRQRDVEVGSVAHPEFGRGDRLSARRARYPARRHHSADREQPLCLAATVRTEGVRINAVSPGATKTARFEATRVVDPQKMDSSIKSLIRYGEPDEMADAVAFLAGPRSKYMSGQVLRVDGGETLFPG
jgi:hypothetical protein